MKVSGGHLHKKGSNKLGGGVCGWVGKDVLHSGMNFSRTKNALLLNFQIQIMFAN